MKLRKVFLLAALCRVIVLSLTILLDLAFPDYDTSSGLTLDCSGVPLQGSGEWGDFLVVWDSVFFMRIAECGYEYEQYHAFFPALPKLLRWLSIICLNRTCLVIWGLILSNMAYVFSAVLFGNVCCFEMCRLTEQVVKDEQCAVAAVLFYSMPPSSVFMSTLYTESFFALFTMSGLVSLYLCNAPLSASFAFALSTTFRSNGILHAGYLAHYQLCKVLGNKKIVAEAVKGIVCIVICLAPFFWFQNFGYFQFCSTGVDVALSRPWCHRRIPYLYGFVQKEYWNVSFLSYHKLSQVPNFLLAAPVLMISLHGFCTYIKLNLDHGLGLGLIKQRKENRGWFGDQVAPFVWQNGLMAIFCLLLMHVQVSTRFLSSCPALYWYMGHLSKQKSQERLLVFYCLSYSLLGALLFPNFYPWS